MSAVLSYDSGLMVTPRLIWPHPINLKCRTEVSRVKVFPQVLDYLVSLKDYLDLDQNINNKTIKDIRLEAVKLI